VAGKRATGRVRRLPHEFTRLGHAAQHLVGRQLRSAPERPDSLAHDEARFDAYYFVGKDVRDVLARYTEWTGRARMLPRWALEYGDADCYNDGDNVKKPGTVPKAGAMARPARRRT
jgi:hypothetical protein